MPIGAAMKLVDDASFRLRPILDVTLRVSHLRRVPDLATVQSRMAEAALLCHSRLARDPWPWTSSNAWLSVVDLHAGGANANRSRSTVHQCLETDDWAVAVAEV